MKNIKFLPLAVLAATLVTFTACEPTDLADDDIQGTWYVSWTKDFQVDILNTDTLKSLCNPGTEAEISIAGLAETKFQGNRTGSEFNTYLKLYDYSRTDQTNSNTLVHTNHYLSTNDIAVSSIDHRDFYFNGDQGHIRKKTTTDGRLILESYRARLKPKFTVFVDLIGEQTRTQTTNGVTTTVSDRNNRLAGVTVDCERNGGPAIEQVYRTAQTGGKDKHGIPVVKSPTIADLNKHAAAFGSSRDVLEAHRKELKTKANRIEAQLANK
jgi:hypothetical protein